MAAILVALLYVLASRLVWYAWVVSDGDSPHRQTDFTKLPQVLPPAGAQLIKVYRGLPHQMWDRGELLRDLLFTRNRDIGGYRFYSTPAVPKPETATRITAAMQSPAHFQPYTSGKACGGYHPDYCFEWQSSQGAFFAMLCASCHEMILIGRNAEVHCDLEDAAFDEFKRFFGEFDSANR
jgi:hypothetical protein